MESLKNIIYRLLGTTEDNLLNVTRMILSFVGIWSEKGVSIVTRTFCMLSISAHMIVGMITFWYRSDEDIMANGVTLIMSVLGLHNVVKTLWCFYCSDKIGWLVNEIERITIENLSKEKSYRQEFFEAANKSKILSISMIVMMIFIFSMETLNCLFLSNNDHRLMFNLYSFIDPIRHYYLALFFQQVYWIWPMPVFITALNILMSFTMITVANLSVLETYFRSAPSNLSRSIDLHNDIIRYVRVMNEVLRPVLISELTSSSILTCICTYMCVKSTTMQHKLIYYSMLLCEFVTPWFICHCGSILEEKSAKLTDAVYSSPWIELKPKQRKEIIILMIVTNRTFQIKLTWTHAVNFIYYTSFIQLSYSLFTLLLSLDSR